MSPDPKFLCFSVNEILMLLYGPVEDGCYFSESTITGAKGLVSSNCFEIIENQQQQQNNVNQRTTGALNQGVRFAPGVRK